MAAAPEGRDAGEHPAAHFRTTRWSLVLEAGSTESNAATEALETLCQAYWYPLYAYVRRKGYDPTESQDLIQEFFARFLATHSLRSVDRRKGRFRSFLLGSMEHFLAKQWTYTHRQKRGGGRLILSLEEGMDPEGRYALEPADPLTPERLFQRRWAMTLLHRTMERLRAEYQQADKGPLFDLLKGLVSCDRDTASYDQIAPLAQSTPGALRVTVHRMRQRYGELLRDEIAQTVSSAEEMEEELKALMAALA